MCLLSRKPFFLWMPAIFCFLGFYLTNSLLDHHLDSNHLSWHVRWGMTLLLSKPHLLIKMTYGLNFALRVDNVSAPSRCWDTIRDDTSSHCLFVQHPLPTWHFTPCSQCLHQFFRTLSSSYWRMLWPQSRTGSTWEFTCPLGGEEEGAGIYQRLKGTGWLKPSSLISRGATHNLLSRVLWDQLRPSSKRHIFPWLSPLLTLLFNIVSSFLCETTNSLHELLTILSGCASKETILTQPIRSHCFSNVRNPVIISSGFAVNIITAAQI